VNIKEGIYYNVIKAILFNKPVVYTSLPRLMKYRGLVDDLREMRCPYCKKKFKSKQCLLGHIKNVHLSEIIDMIENPRPTQPTRILVWDYRTGDVIDALTGEVVDRIYLPPLPAGDK